MGQFDKLCTQFQAVIWSPWRSTMTSLNSIWQRWPRNTAACVYQGHPSHHSTICSTLIKISWFSRFLFKIYTSVRAIMLTIPTDLSKSISQDERNYNGSRSLRSSLSILIYKRCKMLGFRWMRFVVVARSREISFCVTTQNSSIRIYTTLLLY